MILIGQIGERVDLGEVGAEGIERYATRKGLQLPW